MFFRPTFWGAVWLAMVLLVYYDQRLNGRSGIGWAALVLLTGPVGFVIYFLYNRDTLDLAAKRHKKDRLKEALESKIPPHPEPEDRSYLSALPASLTGETPFADPELDALIREGRIVEAREHLQRVIKLSEDMGDTHLAHKYDWYVSRLEQLGS